MWSTLINVFCLATAIIVLFILWLIPAKTKDRNIYLVILMISLIIHSIAELLLHLDFINLYIFSVCSTAMVVNYGPTLYFYVRKFYELPVKNYFWHVIPAQVGLATIWIFAFFGPYRMPQWLLSSYYSLMLVGYLLVTLYIRSSYPLKKHSSWLKTIGIGFGIIVILNIIEVLWINIDLASAGSSAIFNTSLQNVFITAFLLLVIRQIIQNPRTFSEINIRIPSKHAITDFSKSELDLLLSYIEGKKAYKNPNLKCSLVSEVTGIGTNQISVIINSFFKKNFNDWLNDYRIQDAKKLLSESSLTIQEIYFEVGFNSKSAFNSAFKKRVKATPSEFRTKK